MNKKLFLLVIIIAAFHFSYSQVTDSRIIIDTTVRPALYFESNLSASDASDAIESYFDSMHIEKEKGKGFIIKKSLGYLLFRRAKVDYVNDFFDYYFVVNTKKQKGPDGSAIFIAVSSGYNNFLSPDNAASQWPGLKNFASYIQSNYFQQFQLNTSLASTAKDMDKQKKKLLDVLKQKSDLEANISSDSSQISNLQDQLLKLKTQKQ